MPRLAARVKPGPRHPPLWFTPEFPLSAQPGNRHSQETATAPPAGAAERPGGPGERAGRGGRVVRDATSAVGPNAP